MFKRNDISLEEIGEFGLIDRLKSIIGRVSSESLLLGPGDDAAVIRIDDDRALVATNDSMIEGRHFHLAGRDPRLLGRRLASINLSDHAAMGAVPKWALINLSAPGDLSVTFIEELYRGLTSCLRDHGALLAGGNTTRSDKLALDLFLVGEVQPIHYLTRNAGKPGDLLYVTGCVGGSGAGRLLLESDPRRRDFPTLMSRHLDPSPRLRAGTALNDSGLRIAALDISDGLISDLAHLTTDHGLGAEVNLSALPLNDELAEAATLLNVSHWDLSLSGGEDFELLFTLPPDTSASQIAELAEIGGVSFTQIGTITTGNEIVIKSPDGDRYNASPGWDHFAR